jgi:hypothetical protein
VFTVSELDQSYTLGNAIEAFARPEDRKERDAAQQAYLDLVKHAPAPEPSEQELVKWRESNPHGLEAQWRAQRQGRFNEERRDQAAKAAARLQELQGERYARGLKEALLSGAAIASGRLGGLQHPRTEIPANQWEGAWEFRGSANFARGGVPFAEIYNIVVTRALTSQSRFTRRRPSERELSEFIQNLGNSCGADAAWRKAKEHFGADISREKIRKMRADLGIKGRSGRQSG